MGLCAAIGLMGITATTAFAAEEGHEHKAGEKEKIPDTVEGIFKEIHEHHMELKEIVEKKQLAKVHETAFEIRDLAKALVPKAPADKKTQVEGTVKNISKLADDLDASGDANDQAKTEANLKKLDGVLKVLHTQFGMKMEGGEHAMQYTCPMHKDVVQDSPGNCPKCGMKLVAKQEAHKD
ncbi:MAG: hypothetical protein ABS95_00860 [Verrucomicrobia bacterium SCN 57-15]|mgnify:CR=1 FL=1|nr:MAG: hypothetical protein ABS95_00860 [Verrucomicrobia bacterium SCN 57-15]